MIRNYLIIFGFIIFLAFFVFGAKFFLVNGLVIGLDNVWTPFTSFKNFFSQSIFWHIKDIFLYLLDYKILSKLYMLGAFGLAIGLVIFAYKKLFGKLGLGILFPLAFVIINPFFYERILTQPGIVYGILLLGFGLILIVEEFLKDQIGYKNSILRGILWGLAWAIMPHSIFMILLIEVGRMIGIGLQRKNILKEIRKTFIVLGVVLLININWLIGAFLLGNNQTVVHLQRFDKANIKVFEVTNIVFGAPELTTLQLWGFWGERYYHIIPPYKFNSRFYIAGFLILVLIIWGAWLVYQRNKILFFFLIYVAVGAWILGTGTASKIWGDSIWLLYEKIPFYQGLREPGKWIGLLWMVYLIFLLFAGQKLEQIFKKQTFAGVFLIYFLLLIAWVPGIVGGFQGQIGLTDYPQEYKKLSQILSGEYKDVKYILVPWHSYMACDWTRGRIIANVFDKVMYPLNIQKAKNIEMKKDNTYLYSNYGDIDKPVEKFLQTKNINYLKQMNIGGIIYLKTCADFKNYKWLDSLTGTKKIYSGSKLDVYILDKNNE